MKKETIIPFAALCTVPFVLVLSNSMLIPVLPKMQQAMEISLFQAGLIITAFSIPSGLVIPVAGFFSDRYGRKIIMVPALFLFGLGGVLAGISAFIFSNPYYYILAGRIIQGIGGGGTYQLAMALAGDIFQTAERSKALGMLEASNGLGKVVAPLLGAGTALIIWYAPFFVYGILAFTAALLVWFLCQEPQHVGSNQSLQKYKRNLVEIFTTKGQGLAICFLAGMLTLFIFFGVLSYFSDVLEKKFHITGFATGLYIAGPVFAMALTSYLVGTVMQKQLSKLLKPAFLVGLTLQTTALVLFAFFQAKYFLFLSVVVMGVGSGILLPAINTLITSAAQKERGVVTAFYGTVRFFGAALGPPAVGLGLALGSKNMFLIAAVMTAVTAAAGIFFLNPAKMLPAEMRSTKKGKQGQDRGSGKGDTNSSKKK